MLWRYATYCITSHYVKLHKEEREVILEQIMICYVMQLVAYDHTLYCDVKQHVSQPMLWSYATYCVTSHYVK